MNLSGTAVPGTATVTVTTNPAIVYGTAFVSLAAAVAYAGAAPAGGLTFTVGTGSAVAAMCSGTSSPLTCTATYPTSALAAGGYTITATLAADTNYTTASGTGTLTIGQATPAVTVRSLSATPGSSPTLTAIVAYAGAQPTGIFTFQLGASGSNGPTLTATCVVASGTTETCSVAYPTSTFGPGSYTVTGQLAADNNYAGVSGSGTLTVVPASFTASTEPVGTTSPTQTATVVFTTAATLGAINVVTQGAAGLDYVIASGGTCAVGMTVVSGEACTVNYTFAPTRASTRLGGIVVADSSGNVLANSYVNGLGTGPQIAFPAVNTNAVTTTLASGGNNVEGVAVDGSGDVFYANAGANTIVELVAVNGAVPASPATVTFTATSGPVALAVDGSGNLYAAGFNGNLTEYVAVNGSLPANPVMRSFTTGLQNPQSIAVDRNGNVYIGDSGSNQLLEFRPVNGVIPASATPAVIGSGYQAVFGVAVDTAGDVFVSDTGASMVYELMAVSGSLPANPTVNGVGSGFSIPLGLSVDALGDVYVSDQGSNSVKEVVAVNGAVSSSSTILTLGSGFTTPVNSAIDANGNLYIADNANNNVREFNVVSAPALTYANAAVGSSSPAQSVAVENIGNAALTIASVASTAGFLLNATDTTCAAGTLAVAGSCNVAAAFSPVIAGAQTGQINIADNTLNVAGTIQQVQLTGTGTAGTPVVTASGATISYGTASTTLTATIAFSGAAPTGAATFQVDGGAMVAAACTGATSPESCTAAYPASTLSAAAHTITATLAADANYNTASGTATLNVTPITPTIGFSAANQIYGAVAFTVAATSNSGGAFTYSVVSGNATITSAGLVTLMGTGPVMLRATEAAAGNYTAGSQTASFTVNAAAPVIAFSVGNQTYGATPFTVAATSNSTGAITYTVVSGNATVTSAGLVTLTGIGPVTLQATQAAAGNYMAGSQTATFTVNAAAPAIGFSVANETYGAAPFMVSATSNSAAAITYTVVSGNAIVTSAGLVTLTGIGSVTLQAAQAAAGDYTAGTQTVNFTISAEKPTIAFNVASAVYSATPFPVSATSNSTGAFTYTVVSGNATVTSAGVVTLTGVGPVTLQATEAVAGDYTASTAQATFIVSQAGTTTTLTASSASIHPNQTVTLTAQVTPNTSGTPMGSVAFYVNGTILMSVPTTTGVAQLTTLLPPGETRGDHSHLLRQRKLYSEYGRCERCGWRVRLHAYGHGNERIHGGAGRGRGVRIRAGSPVWKLRRAGELYGHGSAGGSGGELHAEHCGGVGWSDDGRDDGADGSSDSA